jgi:hypothetical protein
MADPITLEVRCRDTSGAAYAVDKVILDYGGGTTSDDDAAPFEFQAHNAFEGVIKVQKAGFPDWTFPIRVLEAKGGLVLKFHERMKSPPLMATLAAYAPAIGPNKGKDYVCTLVFGPPKEVVLLSGHDYHGGSANITYATTHMHELWAAKSIDAQTLITVFDCDTGMRERWVKGAGAEKTAKHKFTSGWSLLDETLMGTAPPVPVHGGGDPGADCISITHVYRHLEECGKNRPGSVIEFSVFSHSYFGGPILFNTTERTAYKSIYRRDPLDHDARMWKDFEASNMPHQADFKAAFSATALLKIWGCLAITDYRRYINKARTAKDDVALLGIPEADRMNTDVTPNVPFPDTRPGMIAYLKNIAYKANYMWVLSQVTGRPVYGGALGTGALLLSNGTWNWMYIPEYELEYKGGKRVNKQPYYKKELDFMKANLGVAFSADNYMEYK